MSEKETKNENLLAGSTSEVPDGKASSKNMKHGDESPAMLLALLNSPLESMLDSQQAKILGTCLNRGSIATIVIFFKTQPTGDGKALQPVGNLEIVGNTVTANKNPKSRETNA